MKKKAAKEKAKRGRGRPYAENPLKVRINFRVTEATEKRYLKAAGGRTITEWIRETLDAASA